MISELIAKNIKNKRKELCLTQDYVAKQIDISVQQYQKYENCINKISPDRLYRLSKTFNVSICYFFEEYKAENSLNESVATYDSKDVHVEEILGIMKNLKDKRIKQKILIFAKIIANDNHCLLEDKYD